MPIPFTLDAVIERLRVEWTGVTLLRDLTGVRLSAPEARVVWPRVLEHKWYLSERLGRDVGLRVAAVDFFENIRPRAQRSARHERRSHLKDTRNTKERTQGSAEAGRRQLEARGS